MISEIERRTKVLDYIWEKSLNKDPKITKSDIMIHLKDARPMTTHKIIIELIKEGKIKMVKPKDKPYSRTDYLVINENNEFNKIYRMQQQLENLIDLDHWENKWLKIDPDNKEFRKDLGLLPDYDSDLTFGMVNALIGIIKKKIKSETDRQILYTKTIELMQKTSTFKFGEKEQLEQTISTLEKCNQLSFNGSKDVKLVKEFKDELDKYHRMLIDFRKEFLS